MSKKRTTYRAAQSPYLAFENDTVAGTLKILQIGKEPFEINLGSGGGGGGNVDMEIKNDAVLGGYMVSFGSVIDDSRLEINFADKEMIARLSDGAGTSTVSFVDSSDVTALIDSRIGYSYDETMVFSQPTQNIKMIDVYSRSVVDVLIDANTPASAYTQVQGLKIGIQPALCSWGTASNKFSVYVSDYLDSTSIIQADNFVSFAYDGDNWEPTAYSSNYGWDGTTFVLDTNNALNQKVIIIMKTPADGSQIEYYYKLVNVTDNGDEKAYSMKAVAQKFQLRIDGDTSLDFDKIRLNGEISDDLQATTKKYVDSVISENSKVYIFKPQDGNDNTVFKIPQRAKMFWSAPGWNYEADFLNGVVNVIKTGGTIDNSWLSNLTASWIMNLSDGTYNVSLPIKQGVVQMMFYWISETPVTYVNSETTYNNIYQLPLSSAVHIYKHIINITNNADEFNFVFEILNQSSNNALTLANIALYMNNNAFSNEINFYPGSGYNYAHVSLNQTPVGCYSSNGTDLKLVCADGTTILTPENIQMQRVIEIS